MSENVIFGHRMLGASYQNLSFDGHSFTQIEKDDSN